MLEPDTVNYENGDVAPASLGRVPVRLLVSLTTVLLCTYLPYVWLFFVRAPSSDHRMEWIAKLPLLPGLLPAMMTPVPADATALIFTLGLIAIFTWIGMRSFRWLILAAIVLAIISAPCSYFALAMFRK